MRISLWTAASAVCALSWASGCAHQAKVNEAKLGQLPIEEKQTVFTAQHNVSVAEANKAAADRAKDQAETFQDVAKSELNAAKSRAEAAKNSMDLARKSGSSSEEHRAQSAGDLAMKEQSAAQAKMDYADKLVDERKKESDLAAAKVDSARAELSFVQADALRRHDIEPGVNMEDVTRARDDASRKVVDEERKAAMLRDEVASLRTTWDERRRAFNLAQREMPNAPAVPAPKAPEPIAPERLPDVEHETVPPSEAPNQNPSP